MRLNRFVVAIMLAALVAVGCGTSAPMPGFDAGDGGVETDDVEAPEADADAPSEADVLEDGDVPDEGGGEAFEPPVAVVRLDPDRVPRDDDFATVVTLDGTSSTGGGLVFEWVVPDGRFTDGTGPTDPVARVAFPGTADHEALLRVSNEFGSATAVAVVRTNRVPVAEAGIGSEVPVDRAVSLDGSRSSDPDGDPLAFAWTLTERPAGSTAEPADPAAAVTELVPDQPGAYILRLVVTDGLNDSTPDALRVVAVPPDRDPPSVVVTPTPAAAPVGSAVRICVTATDSSGVAAVSAAVDGVPLVLGADRCASYAITTVARYRATAEARDIWENVGRGSAFFYGRSGSDDGPPTVSITSPVDGSRIATPTEVRGTAEDADLVAYRLEAARRGTTSFVPFAEGSASVVSGVLGRLDPGAFAPGLYDVRLCAEDSWAHSACTPLLVYDLDGGARPGTLRLAFIDARVELLGLPIFVRRVYDSRRASIPGQFGYGWSVEIEGAGTFEESNPPGEGWNETGCARFPFRPVLVELEPHIYVVRLTDRAYRFRFAPTGTACGWGYAEVQPAFAALPGTAATLSAPGFETVGEWWHLSGQIVNVDTFDVYRPTRFVMRTPDGWQYDLEIGRGVTRVADPAGRWLSISAGGIDHSSGVGLDAGRDALGRITSLRREDGATRTYLYDARGDLAGTTDFGGYETRYEYDTEHRLLRIIDPRGGVPGMIEYDAEGRVVAIVDASGRRITLSHDEGARREVVTDRLGNVTILDYDERGNVVRRVDPLGNEWNYSYDASGNLLSETDPTGATTRHEYDAAGNRTATVDPLGNRWTKTYDAGGRPLTETDPLGNARRYEYDPAGNMTASVDAAGARTTYTYDAAGALTGMDLPAAGHVSFTNDSAGRTTSFTDALGRTVTYAYTASGEVASDTSPVEVGGASTTATYRYAYDPRGALTRLDGPDGSRATVEYDAGGFPAAAVGPDGTEQRVSYDSLGRLGGITMPDGERVTPTYDAEDRVTSVVLPDGAAIGGELDALGRLTRLRLPGARTVDYAYDATGRVTRVTNPLGASARYSYDPAGRLTGLTQPDGTSYAFIRDAAGRTTEMTDPAGGRTRFAHDAAGRLTGITFPDGGSVASTYDAAGRLATSRDAAGRTLTYAYDAAGRLTGVTNTLGGTARYAYDAANNLTATTTPGGIIARRSYDVLGRPVERSGGPFDAAERLEYNTGGRVSRVVDPGGGTVVFRYDPAGRLVERRGSDASGETRTFGSGGRVRSVTDASGMTSYLYDAAGRLVRVTRPDGSHVAYAYDAAGNVTEVSTRGGTTTYEWTTEGRLGAVVAPAGGRIAYSYGSAGWLTGATYPSGVQLAVERDMRGRPSRVVYRAPGGAVLHDETYERDGAGRITRVTAGAAVTEYTYDPEGRVASERRPGGREIAYAYDASGNLTTAGTTTFAYDARGRLVSDGTVTWTWDAAGRLAAREEGGVREAFSYDALGRLVRIDRTGASPSRVDLAYDGNDLLARVTVDGEATSLLWEISGGMPLLLEEIDAAGAVRARYAWGHGLVSRRTAGGVRYAHTDARGNVRLETDGSGAVVSRGDYSAYGGADGTAVDGPFGFAGEWRLPGTDLYYFRARFYEPRSGRFITPDPEAPDLNDPVTLNPYLYARGDPVNLRDPAGRFSISEIGTVLSIINVLASIVLLVFPDAETMVLDALGLREVLSKSTTLLGAKASVGIDACDTGAGIGGRVADPLHTVGVGARVGLDAYFSPPTWALWMAIEPFIQFGGIWQPLRNLRDLRRRADLRFGFILGKAKPVAAGFTWDATEHGLLASVSAQYLKRRFASWGMPTFAAVFDFLAGQKARVDLKWKAGGDPKVRIRAKPRLTPADQRGSDSGLRIGFFFQWTFLKLAPPAGYEGWASDLFDRLLEAIAGWFI